MQCFSDLSYVAVRLQYFNNQIVEAGFLKKRSNFEARITTTQICNLYNALE